MKPFLMILIATVCVSTLQQQSNSQTVDQIEQEKPKQICETITHTGSRLEVYNDNGKLSNESRTSFVRAAWEKSWKDIDFLTTIEQESRWDSKALGDKWRAHGLCQWRIEWHKPTIQNKNFGDPYWQLDRCLEYYQSKVANGTIHRSLYGWNVRKKHAWKFKVVETTWEEEKCTVVSDNSSTDGSK